MFIPLLNNVWSLLSDLPVFFSLNVSCKGTELSVSKITHGSSLLPRSFRQANCCLKGYSICFVKAIIFSLAN